MKSFALTLIIKGVGFVTPNGHLHNHREDYFIV